jgi:hypothetical protein
VPAAEGAGVLRFAHEFVRNTIIELIPLTERIQLHATIAAYVSATYPNEPHYFSLLSDQYRHCDEEMAFEFCCKASLHMVNIDVMDGVACLNLLSQATVYCVSVADVHVVMKILAMVSYTIFKHVDLMKTRREEFLKGRTEIRDRQKSFRFVSKTLLGGCCWGSSSAVLPGSPYDEDDICNLEPSAFSGRSKANINNVAVALIQRGLGDLEKDLDVMLNSFKQVEQSGSFEAPKNRAWQEMLFGGSSSGGGGGFGDGGGSSASKMVNLRSPSGKSLKLNVAATASPFGPAASPAKPPTPTSYMFTPSSKASRKRNSNNNSKSNIGGATSSSASLPTDQNQDVGEGSNTNNNTNHNTNSIVTDQAVARAGGGGGGGDEGGMETATGLSE